MEIGRKVYYELSTGNVLVDTGEVSFGRKATTEDHFEAFPVLQNRAPESIGVIELEYGQFSQDFIENNGYRVNIETGELEFSYPDPNEPEPQEQVFQQPLTEQVKALESRTQATEDMVLQLLMEGVM